MCGISGFIHHSSSYLSGAVETVKDMTYFNRLRGVDALGFVKVQYNGDYETHKGVGDPIQLMGQKDFKDFLQNIADRRYLIQHNRLATKGEKKALTCAHPFIASKGEGMGVIVGVHNGTLTHIKNEKEYPGYSDSHSLIKMLAAGLKMEEIENSIWGPYAIVWYDSMLRTLNFARNDSRPMGFVNCPDSNSIWFGSEVYMMGAALDRNRVKIKLGAGGFVRMPEFEHWIWQQDDKKFEKIQFKKRVAVSYSSAHSWPQGAGWWGEDEIPFEHTSIADHPLKQEGSKSPLALPPPKNPDTAIPKPIGSGSGPTKVEPFPGGGSEIVQPSYHYPLRRMAYKEKPKWMPMANSLGMERGDFLLFSLVDHSGTKRGTQVAMEGRMIAYSNETLHFLGHVEVYGMVGLSMGMVDNSKSLWRGIVSDIQMAKVGKSIHAKDYRYRFHLKDIEQDSAEDPFKEKVKLGKKDEVHHAHVEIVSVPEEEECSSIVEDCTTAQECVLLSKKNPKTQEQPATQAGGKQWIEEKESNDSGGLLHVKCDDCQAYFQRSSMHKIQDGEAADAIRLRFCGPCYTGFTLDASRLDTLFANAKLERASKFFHNDNGPFYDGERLPIVH